MDPIEARRLFATAPVARLATVDGQDRPTAVPICFALTGDTLYSAVDDKPKTTTDLARLANVAHHPGVAVLADHYDDDWAALWWVRGRGAGRLVVDDGERERAVALLRAKYPQYAGHALDGAVLAVDVSAWLGWRATSRG